MYQKLGLTLLGCAGSLMIAISAFAQQNPTVELPNSDTNPPVPSGNKVTCLANPNDPPDTSSTCPVLEWNGYTY